MEKTDNLGGWITFFVVLFGSVCCSLLLFVEYPKQQQQYEENIKLKTQLEMTQKQLEECKLTLSAKREK